MKKIVIGDIHGCYRELKELYNSLVANGTLNLDKDQLIFLGDYIDRGPDCRLVVQFVRNLQENNKNVIALMGNHEDMLLEYIRGLGADGWLNNGYEKTLISYAGYPKEFQSDTLWMESLPLYYQDEHFVYVHAGIDTSVPLDEQERSTLLWVREPFLFGLSKYEKKVIFGHTPTLLLCDGSSPVRTENGNIDIDTGCVFGGKLTALVIEDNEFKSYWQIDNKLEVSRKDIQKEAA